MPRFCQEASYALAPGSARATDQDEADTGHHPGNVIEVPPDPAAAGRHGPHKPCYCETVKNITVSVPDGVYHDARVAAAQRDTSLSALVVAYLERLSGRTVELARLEALQQEVQAEIGQFRAADRLGRDEVHDRAVH
jgi:hypothetical protein